MNKESGLEHVLMIVDNVKKSLKCQISLQKYILLKTTSAPIVTFYLCIIEIPSTDFYIILTDMVWFNSVNHVYFFLSNLILLCPPAWCIYSIFFKTNMLLHTIGQLAKEISDINICTRVFSFAKIHFFIQSSNFEPPQHEFSHIYLTNEK